MEFLQPRSLHEALAAKAERPEAVAIAGGTDVMVELNFDRRRPEVVLDLSRVGEGARTGLASVVTGLLFLVALFLTPLVEVIPQEAAAPALVVVGFLLMRQVADVDWADPEIAIPAFLTIVLMPFTFSITNGIGAGFIAYVLIKAFRGRWREPSLLLWIIAFLFLIYFAIDPVQRLLGV
jgi:AGZA family xanthine/uracil permease-like MFS transporter